MVKYKWGNKIWEPYIPKKNKTKFVVFAGLFGISFAVPFMTTAMVSSLKIISKYKPLYFFT